MNGIKSFKGVLNRGIYILLSLLLLLLVIWLGFSFFSMKGDSQYLKTAIKVVDNELTKKVLSSSYKRDGKYIKYRYDIVPISISYEKDFYVIEGYDNNFLYFFEDVEDAKFNYSLEKSKGEFDFTVLKEDQPISLFFVYRVDNDLRYFAEYSGCALKKVYAQIFNIENEYSKGICTVNRKAYKWEVEVIEKQFENE